jgi:hypothetical protein
MRQPLPEKQIRKIAKKSDHKWAHHVAVITGAGITLAVGFNKGEMHAEEMALRKLGLSGEKRAKTLYSLRVRRDGKMGASKPCEECEKLLRKSGIKYVFYNDYDGAEWKMAL